MSVVVLIRVEDVNTIISAEKTDLIAMFDQFDLPHVISETHYIISSDMLNDNAFVQKALDDHVITYNVSTVPDIRQKHVRSDGCKVQNVPLPHPISTGYWYNRVTHTMRRMRCLTGSVQACL